MDTIKGKFHCNTAGERVDQWNPDWKPEHVELSVVTGQTPEDQAFYASSPGGEIKLMIANPGAKGFFKPGKKYYATFEEAAD